MLQKRIDLGSQPYGLAIAGEDIVKGSAVIVKLDSGVWTAFLPTTQAEADAVKGFATYRMEDEFGADTAHDTILEGSRLVIYTLVKDNMWATTQFDGTLVAGDELVVDYSSDHKGSLRKLTTTATTGEVATGRAVQFVVYSAQSAGAGYTSGMVNVTVN